MHAWGLRLRRVLQSLALPCLPVLPSALLNCVGTLIAIISQLDTQPACAPVNASRRTLRCVAHDSGSGRFATPFLCDSFIHYSMPVFTSAPGENAYSTTINKQFTSGPGLWPARILIEMNGIDQRRGQQA